MSERTGFFAVTACAELAAILLKLSGTRVGEERRGEDPESAGEWIQVIDLRRRSDPGVARVEFS